MEAFPNHCTLVLLIFIPQVSSLPFIPFLMTDPNKAKEYGIGTAVLACTIASLLASILCMYWFCRMRKRFRHRLVMILIYGDLMRGTWLFVFAIISMARGTVRTSSSFCQVSGFLVQYGTQTSDYAVLVMALHSAIQVFYPSTLVSSDGLYPYRRYVYVGAFVLPILMAALAFINPTYAYVSQGAFCTLPIRPFWYRLALTWVPRYIIVVVIIGLAIAIHTHVGFEFRSYTNASNVEASFQSLKTSDGSATPQDKTQNDTKMEDITFELTTMQSPRPQPQRRNSSIGHDIFTSQRQACSAPVLSPGTPQSFTRVSFDDTKTIRSLPSSSLHLSRSGPSATRPGLPHIPSGQSVISPMDRASEPKPTEPTATSSSSPKRTPSSSSPAQVRLAKQRQRIQRQLRLMFIYPLVYTLMWLIPFAMHCMNYWDRWAQTPVEFLRVGSSICIALMGFTDALIFSLREKPWRGIEGSDGTFWGSFVCQWCGLGDVEVAGSGVDVGGRGGRDRGSQSYRTSASGDFARVAAEQARVRLELEREERLAALEFKQGDQLRAEEQGDKFEGKVDRKHKGLKVGDGDEGQVYDDNGLEDNTAKLPYNEGYRV